MNKILAFCFLILFSFFFFRFSLNAQTTIEKIDGRWTLLVDGEPFPVKGATFGYDKYVDNYDKYFKELNFLGVNTIRTWATGENTESLLNAAQKHNIKVMVGIWMRHGRPGMEDDDRFDYLKDEEGKQAMYKDAIEAVQKYKDHPAVLTWGIGNEVYLNTATDEEKEAYSKFLESICKEIKTIDQNHPITSVEAWTFGLDWWQKYVPSLDIYGLNSYGAGANFLSAEIEKKGIDKPYIITEFGVTGEWDIQQEKNGVKVEPTDQEKYDAIVKGYNEWIKPKSDCLGVYVFHYGNGNNFATSWLLTHYNKMTRPQYWAIREAYTAEKPLNFVPKISSFELTETKSQSEKWVPVQLECSDQEQEDLEVSFYYNQRTGSRKRRDQILPLAFRGNMADGFEIQLPKEDGGIKVYVHAKDTYNNVGIASTSILVSDKEASQKKYLVPKVQLPFYVYQDNEDLPYFPSGYMGNYKAIELDLNHTKDVYSGNTAIKIRYNERDNWYGVAFVDPANDWGEILGGYDIGEAKKFSFWAKADQKNIKATVGFGLIDKDKPFPDTGKKSIEIVLTEKWKKYTIKAKKEDLSCIRSGFVIFSSSDGFPHEIYIDDILFE